MLTNKRKPFVGKASNSTSPLTLLGGISPEQFLSEYWQKKPLLIRQAIPNFACPVSPDELAGLALEPEVESRLIIEHGSTSQWELRTGPFEDDAFSSLPETHWTLLIQQLDAWVPEINALKSHFNFIPNWRIDDVMASYAPKGGSVGPHFDYYDVFLLQAQGHRRWQLGQQCDEHSPTLEGTPLSILQQFEGTEDWLLQPGDMLYLPPQLAHYGIAQDECITLSIGFRAPTHAQLLDDFSHHILEQDLGSTFYQDADLVAQPCPGEISTQARQKIDAILDQHLNDPLSRARWLVEYSSTLKSTDYLGEAQPEFQAEDLLAILKQGQPIYQNEGSRFVYCNAEGTVLLGVDGTLHEMDGSTLTFVQYLCSNQLIDTNEIQPINDNPAIFDLILKLIRGGSLYC